MIKDANKPLPDAPPPGAADWTIDQRWADYTPAEHAAYLKRESDMAGKTIRTIGLTLD